MTVADELRFWAGNGETESQDTMLRAAREIEMLRQLAKSLSDALLTVRPLGGSELFKRFGDTFYADPAYCGAAIKDLQDSLHEARKKYVITKRELDATLANDPPSIASRSSTTMAD